MTRNYSQIGRMYHGRTIRLTQQCYDKLIAMKKPEESFNMALHRLLGIPYKRVKPGPKKGTKYYRRVKY